MVALERQDEDLCRLFAKNAARVALSESSRGSRDRSDRSDRYDDHKYLRVKTVCFLADVYLEQARALDASTHEGQADRRRLTDEASNYYYQAARIDGGQMLPHLGLGS